MAVAKVKTATGWQRVRRISNKQTYEHINFDSGTIGDYFTSYDTGFTLDNTIKYAGAYSTKFTDFTNPGVDKYAIANNFNSSIVPDRIDIYVRFDGGLTENDDMAFRVTKTDDSIVNLWNFRRDYGQSSPREAILLGFTDTDGTATGVVIPTTKWIRFTLKNIDYSAMTLDAEIYNETDSTSLYTNSGHSHTLTSLKGWDFRTQTDNNNGPWYLDELTFNSNGVNSKWQRNAGYVIESSSLQRIK